jgi:hypothetical protein
MQLDGCGQLSEICTKPGSTNVSASTTGYILIANFLLLCLVLSLALASAGDSHSLISRISSPLFAPSLTVLLNSTARFLGMMLATISGSL